MKIDIIGSRGYPFSYASAEDMVREFGPRFLRDGHQVTIHCWADYDASIRGVKQDHFDGIKRVFHKNPGGKISGQFFVALKASWFAAKSDSDVIFYIFVNSGIFGWIPKLFGKKIFTNIDGVMWKDPKWPRGIRHVFFPAAAYLSIFLGKAITDSIHMKAIYKQKFKVNIDWIGYGCSESPIPKVDIDENRRYINGYYLVMSRITPHNLTDLIVDGFIRSKSKAHLIVAGHTPDSRWFKLMKERSCGHNVTFLGLVRDQNYLNQLILNAKAYLHGHSLGGINPALVRITGMDIPTICVDTVFNREVVEDPNKRLQALMFEKNEKSVASAINSFESDPVYWKQEACNLGSEIRKTMSWEQIYCKYKHHIESLLNRG